MRLDAQAGKRTEVPGKQPTDSLYQSGADLLSEGAKAAEAQFYVDRIESSGGKRMCLVWGHGWGQSGAAFRLLAEALAPFAPSLLIDFPGFGKSARPVETWGTAEYAEAVAAWLEADPWARDAQKLVWIGHSFGCRVGIQLATRVPNRVNAMALIAAAGLPRRRSPLAQAGFQARRMAISAARRIAPGAFTSSSGSFRKLRSSLESADYRSAGAMRPILSRVVSEDLTAQAREVRCPTLIVYGDRDTETPPEMGHRLHRLIPGSELAILSGYGHLNILSDGRHQLVLRLRRFLDQIR